MVSSILQFLFSLQIGSLWISPVHRMNQECEPQLGKRYDSPFIENRYLQVTWQSGNFMGNSICGNGNFREHRKSGVNWHYICKTGRNTYHMAAMSPFSLKYATKISSDIQKCILVKEMHDIAHQSLEGKNLMAFLTKKLRMFVKWKQSLFRREIYIHLKKAKGKQHEERTLIIFRLCFQHFF